MTTPVPIIADWLELGDEPALIGSRCEACTTVAFPPRVGPCPNPHCDATELVPHRLATQGRIWSYTDAQYQPPAPYVSSTEPYVPFAIAAVELEADGIVVIGQLAAGYTVADVRVGDEVRLTVERQYDRDGADAMAWKWQPLNRRGGTT